MAAVTRRVFLGFVAAVAADDRWRLKVRGTDRKPKRGRYTAVYTNTY